MPAAAGVARCQDPPGSAQDAAAWAGPAASAQHAPARTAASAARSRIATLPLWGRVSAHSTLVLDPGLEVGGRVEGVEPERPPDQGLGPGRQRRLELERGAQRAGHEHLVTGALHRVRDRRPYLRGVDPLAPARGP